MEGINLENRAPTVEGGDTSPETRGEKIERAEKSVRHMFDERMEAAGLIRRVIEDNRSSFKGPEERF